MDLDVILLDLLGVIELRVSHKDWDVDVPELEDVSVLMGLSF